VYNFDNSVAFPQLGKLPDFYKNILTNYNSAFVTSKEQFLENILEQSIWRNKFITHIVQKKKNCLYLRNWIRSGVRKVKDLKCIDGYLDVNRMYD